MSASVGRVGFLRSHFPLLAGRLLFLPSLSYTSDEDYESYLQLAKSISSYNTGVEVNKDSKIVTLSTCTNVREDERFLVYGVLTKEETADGDSEDTTAE